MALAKDDIWTYFIGRAALFFIKDAVVVVLFFDLFEGIGIFCDFIVLEIVGKQIDVLFEVIDVELLPWFEFVCFEDGVKVAVEMVKFKL